MGVKTRVWVVETGPSGDNHQFRVDNAVSHLESGGFEIDTASTDIAVSTSAYGSAVYVVTTIVAKREERGAEPVT